jgi:hypothetical protein
MNGQCYFWKHSILRKGGSYLPDVTIQTAINWMLARQFG